MEKTRIQELEQHFEQFRDVPREVILKEDLLRLGLRFSQAAVEAAKGSPMIRGTLFTQLKVKYDDLAGGEGSKVPEEVRLIGGPYDLRRTIVYNRANPNSPYLVDVVDGRLVLTADGVVIADVRYPVTPRYFSKKFEDGTAYAEVLPLRAWNCLAFNNLYRVCQLWGEHEECKFCDINQSARERGEHGVGWTRKKAYKSPDQVAEVAEEIFVRDGYLPGQRPAAVFMTGGAILKDVAGKSEDDFYMQYVEAVRDRIGNRMPIFLQTEAKDKEACKRYRDAGVTSHGANIEVWDKELFKWICPGKDKYIGRDEWIKRVVESVDVFGEGNVCPNFVLGVESAQPYGFKDLSSALGSIAESLEFLMSHGVTPRWESWNISPYSALAGNPVPPLELFVRANLLWCEIWNKHDLPPLHGMGSMGPGRARNHISALHDMDSSLMKPRAD